MILAALGLGVLFVLHAAFSGFVLVRPDRVISFLANSAASRRLSHRALMRSLATLPPYAWLLAGRGWDAFLDLAPNRPNEFTRLIMAVRLLGALALCVNISIVAVTVALTFVT